MPAAPAVEACPACGAVLRTPLLCEGCGTLLEARRPPTPFEALGLEPAYALDLTAVRKRLLALSRALHPDVHARAGEGTRRLAEDNTAALNAAFQVLADDARRADWLVRSRGGPREEEERSMPRLFLEDVLEWNEAIDEARSAEPDSSARRALAPLAERLRSERARGLAAIAAALTPLPASGSPVLRGVRQQLNALRYLDRALREIDELALAST
jgi:molecular chaperone HscB